MNFVSIWVQCLDVWRKREGNRSKEEEKEVKSMTDSFDFPSFCLDD